MNLKIYIKQKILTSRNIAIISSFLFNNVSFNNVMIKGRNNRLIKSTAFIDRCKVKLDGQNNQISFGDFCHLKDCRINVTGKNNTIIFQDNVKAFQLHISIEDNDNQILIGDGTIFSGEAHLACIEGTSISIGKNCLISSEVVFRTGDSHSIIDLDGFRTNISSNINVNDHVWVCHKVLINKGTSIPKNCIIATGAIVTKKFSEENSIIGGIPAKIIKSNINWDSSRNYKSRANV